jgi:hypothetical protein
MLSSFVYGILIEQEGGQVIVLITVMSGTDRRKGPSKRAKSPFQDWLAVLARMIENAPRRNRQRFVGMD